MTVSREHEITKKAIEINDFSDQYQLPHALFASELYVQNDVKAHFEQRRKELIDKIKTASERLIPELQKEQIDFENQISQRRAVSLGVEYISCPINEARTVKAGNSLTILLSNKLLCSSTKNEVLSNMRLTRELMAHELGHVVLHTSELLDIDGTQGSAEISENTEKEHEATLFGDELLKARSDMIKKMKHDGRLDVLFGEHY